jgi:RNA polymerase sigma-70 factor (ECF subfamily)
VKRHFEFDKRIITGYRTVFNMYVVEGYTHKEIGDILGISEGTSKSQLARARMILQDMVINHLDERDRKQKKVE